MKVAVVAIAALMTLCLAALGVFPILIPERCVVVVATIHLRVADKRDRAPFNPMLAASARRPPIDLAFADLLTIARTIDRELAIFASATPLSTHPANLGIKIEPEE